MLIFGQVSVPVSTPTLVCTMPAGACRVQLVLGGTNPAYVGTSNSVTTTTGAPVTQYVGLTMHGFSSSPATQIWANAPTGGAIVGYVITTAE